MEEDTHLADLLRDRKLKATSTRLDVLSVISDYKKAIPFSKIQDALNNFDRVTLYRTIHSLMEKGIIHKALVEGSDTFYAVCSNNCSSHSHNHKHIHFKCSSCQAVTCVQADSPISFSIPGHSIENFEIEVTGVCTTCNY
ncbi:MAG: Fur family ferric uptake transcriptional regulator [Salibacteraceae bacterium]|jgi:Fur family ferric uptake transcriptional regulator